MKPVARSAVRITTRGLDHLALALSEFVGALEVPTINPELPDREQVRKVWADAQGTLAERQATFITWSRK